MQNPTRREILTLLKDTAQPTEKLSQALQLDEQTLQYHLQFLKDIFFITVEKGLADVTPLGIAYLRNALGWLFLKPFADTKSFAERLPNGIVMYSMHLKEQRL